MKRSLLVIMCLFFLMLSSGFAQQPNDPATKEDVQKIFEITASRKLFDSVMTAMRQQLPAMMESTLKKQLPDATPEQIAQMQTYTNSLMDKMFASMPYDEMMQASIPTYQRHFTHGEIQELIQFYNSPIGKKVINEMPAMMAETMQEMMPIMQKWASSATADMMKSAEEYAKGLKDKKGTPAPKPSSKS